MLCKQLLLRSSRAWRSLIETKSVRDASILSALNSSPVLISSNNDIYTNLALEHWLYSNIGFQCESQTGTANFKTHLSHPIVLIWTDGPSLVFGRHQNPWVESNLGLINKVGIKVARRHSGGGCVYHDENNINISIIGERKLFENRQSNLKFLAGVLDKKYGIKCEPNARHDIIHSATGSKMSGSAAKLGRHNSYHHFTLLVNTDKEVMKAAIRQEQQDHIQTNSTPSTRSSVVNMSELNSGLTTEQVIADIAQSYSELYSTAASKHESRKGKIVGDIEDLESLTEIKQNLMGWDWIYGMTPKFRLERNIDLVHEGRQMRAIFSAHIEGGQFKSFDIQCDEPNISIISESFASLVNTSFNYQEAMVNVAKLLGLDRAESDLKLPTGYQHIFATHLLQMIHKANF